MADKEMKLWLLRPEHWGDGGGNEERGLWNPWYDKCFGVVVRAGSEETARLLASAESGDEGDEAWLSPARTTCEELTADGPAEVVISDFRSA